MGTAQTAANKIAKIVKRNIFHFRICEQALTEH